MSISSAALCFLSLSKSSVRVFTISMTLDLKIVNSPWSFSKASFQELSAATAAPAAGPVLGGGAAADEGEVEEVEVLLEEEGAGVSWEAGDGWEEGGGWREDGRKIMPAFFYHTDPWLCGCIYYQPWAQPSNLIWRTLEQFLNIPRGL